MSHVSTRKDLMSQIEQGVSFKYLYFWGHTRSGSEVGKECLSQWYPSSFVVDDASYATAEHWMMAEKARVFDDEPARQRILASEHPGAAKKLGREVRGFDQESWDYARIEVVVSGNLAKFSQNRDLGHFLETTGQRVLVEASPRDRIWGIGMSATNKAAEDPARWNGQNLLGFALMAVRERLRTGGAC